ncbi:HNH endonuclease [Bacillaceae bacterium C204]|uniref:HNH endonuclease n=1 Tax=Neobacillus sp. 204 TaxID=3383351 RepID=UPI00397D18F2
MKNKYKHNGDGTTTIYVESLDRLLEVRISTEDINILESRGYNICVTWDKTSRTFYVKSRGKYVHRLLMDPPKGMQVHHIDGNGLNNTRQNLEVLTLSEHARKKRSKEPIVGDPSKGVQVHILSKAEPSKKQSDKRHWFRLEVNGLHYGTFDCDINLSLHANITDMVVNRKLNDEQIYAQFLSKGHNEEHVGAVIKEDADFSARLILENKKNIKKLLIVGLYLSNHNK